LIETLRKAVDTRLLKKTQLDDTVKLEKELSEARDEVVLLNEEQDEQKESITKASLEATDLKMMLVESAKENHELEERLRENYCLTSESLNAVEEMTKEVEELREEKQALANNLNASDEEIRNLISQIKIMEGDPSYGADNRMPGFFDMKDSINDNLKKIDEQAKDIEERDSRIEALQHQLTEGSSGNGAQQVIDISTELGSLRKKHKTEQLESSVQLAKKDAMIAKLNDQLCEANEENIKEAKDASSLREEIENSKVRLRAALQEIEESKSLHKRIEELEQRAIDAETVEKGLHDAIDKWTDKTFEWKMKAEGLEKELDELRGGGTDNGERPQTGVWGIFGEN
jgi:chromosome segregation ATPase